MFFVVDIARARLYVVKDVVFSQSTIAGDINGFDDLLRWRWILLGYDASGGREDCDNS